MGCVIGIIPVDETLVEFYQNRLKKLNKPDHPRINNQTINQLINNKLTLDNDAVYAKHLQIDLSSLSPYISVPILSKFLIHYTTCPNKTLPLIKLYLVSCTNSRLSDIQAAADIIKGHKVNPNVEFYVAAASSLVQKDAEQSGAWQTILDAGLNHYQQDVVHVLDWVLGY